MLQNQRRVAGALLLLCVAAYSRSSWTASEEAAAFRADQGHNPGEVLKETVHISAGGPYETKAGLPITLHGEYIVAGQTENSDRLKVIGQALKSYLRDHGSYPPAALLNARGRRTVSWRVLILPYLGEKELYDEFDLTKPWDDPANRHLLWRMPEVYRKSGASWNETETGFAGIQGPESVFQNASAKLNGGLMLKMFSAREKIAAGPVGDAVHLPWTAPGDIDIKRMGKLGSHRGFSGVGHAFTPLLFLDGTVHLMPNDVDPGSLITWTHVSEDMMKCACAPPNSADAGISASWELGRGATLNTQGWDVTFLAHRPGTYSVTMHVFDHFGNEYNRSTTVRVR